jgi:hypothetical protein
MVDTADQILAFLESLMTRGKIRVDASELIAGV